MFCDGSTKSAYGRLFSGYGVYFGKKNPYNVMGANTAVTSTMAELMAIREAYRMIAYLNKPHDYMVYTDCIAAFTMVKRHAHVNRHFNPVLKQIWRCERAVEGTIDIEYTKGHQYGGNQEAHLLARRGREKAIKWWQSRRC